MTERPAGVPTLRLDTPGRRHGHVFYPREDPAARPRSISRTRSGETLVGPVGPAPLLRAASLPVLPREAPREASVAVPVSGSMNARGDLGPKSPTAREVAVPIQPSTQVLCRAASESKLRPTPKPVQKEKPRRSPGGSEPSPPRQWSWKSRQSSPQPIQRGLGNAACDAPPERPCWSRIGWQTERYRARGGDGRHWDEEEVPIPRPASRFHRGYLAGDKISQARASIAARKYAEQHAGRSGQLSQRGMTRSTREKESPELVLQTGRNVSNQTGKVTDKKMHRLQLYVRPTRLHPGRSQPCRSYAVDITINKISFSIDSDLTSRRLLSALASVCQWLPVKRLLPAVSQAAAAPAFCGPAMSLT